jgi:hypothetical protein
MHDPSIFLVTYFLDSDILGFVRKSAATGTSFDKVRLYFDLLLVFTADRLPNVYQTSLTTPGG